MSNHDLNFQDWHQLDVFNQMGNIGSEVGRALAAKRAGKSARMMTAFYRGMDLINATVSSWQARQSKAIPELLIAREQFAKSILSDYEDSTLEKYFMDFALVARSSR